MRFVPYALLSLCVTGFAQEPALVPNGDFETLKPVTPDADGLLSGWTLGTPPQLPEKWALNSAYPGEISIGTEGAYSGETFVRLRASGKTSAHLYQTLETLRPGTWYRVSLWVRGGPVHVQFYQYFASGPIVTQIVGGGEAPADEWRRVNAYYQAPLGDFLRAAFAVETGPGHTADIDAASMEVLELPEVPGGGRPVVFENDLARLAIAANGRLEELGCRATGENYAAEQAPLGVFSATRDGRSFPAHLVTAEDDVLTVQFIEPDVRAKVRVTPRKEHFLLEVLQVEPQDVESLTIEFPLQRLATVGAAFNATYDDQFGACFFGTTVNSRNLPTSHSTTVQGLRVGCYAKHGMVGAKFALVAAPMAQFNESIMAAERDNGLPCPLLEGKWARFSEPVRRSYLFGVGVTEQDVDKLIEYAKIGNFGTIIILKNDWLANHGHYDINTRGFPEGVASVKRMVDKIHAAGMGAGVHVFGPSISPNDPYITPKPDDRLATVPCPPLAEAVDEQATTLTFAEQPNLPPKNVETQAFPGRYLRIGDEIIRYGEAESGPPFRYTGCVRGALGTGAQAHPAGAEVKGLLAMWGFFLVDPDSTLAEEITQNFADLVNECGFDMVYFDASDGIQDAYLDRWYYLNKLHLGYYSKFNHDVLYQTSNGTGWDICWHIVPRSASADGHGDLKWYLDQRLNGMLGMAANYTRSDVGWYYMFDEVRPDQIEYVCAKTIGIDGSISIETSRASMEKHPRARQMIEMVGRYEKCRLSRYFPEEIRERLKEPARDFKLFARGEKDWVLYRARYEEPRTVDVLDGAQNVFPVHNDGDGPRPLGVEIVRGDRKVVSADYQDPAALTIETFDDAAEYRESERNDYEKFVIGGDKVQSDAGPVRQGVTQSFSTTAEGALVGGSCGVYSAKNAGIDGGWGGIGRRFAEPLDLSAYKAICLQLHGDEAGGALRFQFRDVAGQSADLVIPIGYKGWRMHTMDPSDFPAFDWSKTEYLLFYFNGLPQNADVKVLLDDVRAVPNVDVGTSVTEPTCIVNGTSVTFPVELGRGQAVTAEGLGGVSFWQGGMLPGRTLEVSQEALVLQPGENVIELQCKEGTNFAGDVEVLLYQMWPMEK